MRTRIIKESIRHITTLYWLDDMYPQPKACAMVAQVRCDDFIWAELGETRICSASRAKTILLTASGGFVLSPPPNSGGPAFHGKDPICAVKQWCRGTFFLWLSVGMTRLKEVPSHIAATACPYAAANAIELHKGGNDYYDN
jgi:hypothetical protein